MPAEDGSRDGAPDRFGRALDRVIAEAAAAEATRERVHERTLRTVAEAEATFVGVAVDLAEAGLPVVVRTAGGRSHRGRVRTVGLDFLVVNADDRPLTLLALTGIVSIRSWAPRGERAPDTAGARPAPFDVSFAGLLAELGAERPRVQVVAVGDEPVTGELRAVGSDVVTLRLDATDRPLVHLRLAAVDEVVLLDR